ncbi:MAG: flippase [Candidatus Moranbacteria bacterium]|nr:flippase [Candidatus Moranbacteria bacterium]
MSRQTAIKSIFWLTFSEILFNLSGYIIHAVAGRTLGPADYGRYSLVITLTTVIVVLIGNGIPTAMSRYLSEAFEKNPALVLAIKKQSIRLQSLLMGGVTVVFFLASPLIAEALNDPTLTPLFRLSAFIIPAFAAASFYFSYFTGLHLFNNQSILKSFRSVARITVTVGLVLTFGLKGAIAGYILAPLLTFFLGLYLDSKVFAKDYARLTPDQTFPYQKLLYYAWPITLFMLFYEIFVSVDLYLIKSILRDDVATGLYNAALTIGRIPYYLFYALSIFLLPALAKIKSENDTRKISQVMTQSLRYAGIILLPTYILIVAYATPLTELFFGNKYIAATPVLQVLVLGLSFLTVFYLLCSAFNGIGHARLSMWLSIIGTFFNIILNYILIRQSGIMGAAYATTISAAVTTAIALIISQRYIPLTLHWSSIIKTLLVSGALWLIVSAFPAHDWLFIPYSLVFGALYTLALIHLNVITKEDMARFQKKKSLA